MLISVIVPVYKVEPYLNRCVDSILGQTYQNLEVILVNDGSKDGSGSICDAYAQKDSRIRVIHKENGGLSSARNAGMDAATGEYITFVDSDDWLEADGYEHLMDLMERYQVKLVCGGNYDVDGETGERTLGVCPAKEEVVTAEEFVGRMFLWQGCDSSVCDKLFHRDLFASFRFPVGKVSEDVALTYKIVLGAEREFAENGWRAIYYGNYEEAWDLLDFAFDGYKICRLLHDGQSLYQFNVSGGENQVVAQSNTAMDAILPVSAKMKNLLYKYNVKGGGLTAPIADDQVIATLQIWYQNSCIAETELHAMSSVRAVADKNLDLNNSGKGRGIDLKSVLAFAGIVFLVIFVPFAIYLIVNNVRRAYTRNRRRRRRQSRRRSR